MPVDAHTGAAGADVCLVLEGTYPYVKGGVSTWVHDLIGSLPELQFTLVHVGPERGTYPRRRYSLPANVVALSDLYCREPLARGLRPARVAPPFPFAGRQHERVSARQRWRKQSAE